MNAEIEPCAYIRPQNLRDVASLLCCRARAPTYHIPIIGKLFRPATKKPFRGSTEYWIRRYEAGKTSGVGSYGKFARYKAKVLNEFVSKHSIESVIEYGCGDGNKPLAVDVAVGCI